LTTEDTFKMVAPDNVKRIEFRSVIIAGRPLKWCLVRAKADVVITALIWAITEDGNPRHQAPGDVEMARTVSIDLVVSGPVKPACMKAGKRVGSRLRAWHRVQTDHKTSTWIDAGVHSGNEYVLGRAD
jgi:5'-nucleotidase/UDP-sugar diphosphatase